MTENIIDTTEQSVVSDFTSIGEIVNQALKKDQKEIKINNGISTGFTVLDKEISGFKNGQLNTISVKPGMGKTALLLSIASNLSIKRNHSIAIFSLERNKQKITNRIIESETGLSVNNVVNRKFEASYEDHLQTLLSNIAKANIFIDDKAVLSHNEICTKATELKRSNNIELIIIDYLELLVDNIVDKDAREKQLKIIMQSLNLLAKELNIPFLLFSQYNSLTEDFETKKKPSLNLLPEYISDFSDVVIFLHRSDLYSKPNGNNSHTHTVELVVSKFGNMLEPKYIPLKYIDSIAKFIE